MQTNNGACPIAREKIAEGEARPVPQI
jgi:hypothetical protein